MARVLKYQLKSLTEQNVKTCTGKVLTVQLQSGKPMMWVLVEDEKKNGRTYCLYHWNWLLFRTRRCKICFDDIRVHWFFNCFARVCY